MYTFLYRGIDDITKMMQNLSDIVIIYKVRLLIELSFKYLLLKSPTSLININIQSRRMQYDPN